MWHSDSSYKAIPARYSLLCAHVLPPEGGDTQFADMRAAYDMLDAKAEGADRRSGLRAQPDFLQRRPGHTVHREGIVGILLRCGNVWCARIA